VEFQPVARSVRVFHCGLHSKVMFGVRQDELQDDALARLHISENMNGDSALAYIENMALELGCAATHVDVALYLEARMPSLSALSDSRTSIDRDHRELSNSGGLKLVKTTKPASRTAVSFWNRPLSP